MPKECCIIIPAVKKAAVIPDQLVKKLAGVTLIQRALNTAKELNSGADIHVVTDSEEIALICSRNRVNYYYEQALRLNSSNILFELKPFIEKLAALYKHLIIYRAASPLVDHHDIQDAYNHFLAKDADILVTLKKQEHRIWKATNGHLDQLIYDESTEPILIEIKSFIILKSSSLNGNHQENTIVPFYLDEKAVEISSYQDWWICEKLLQQKHIVFVVTGYAAIGLGHVFRALTLAHEITDHRITFLCTREGELAVRQIAERDYKTILQKATLLEDVVNLEPDLVINDILNTDEEYIKGLKQRQIKVVNFEDSGPGAEEADLVVNALYSPDVNLPDKFLCGHAYFCLRDEFIDCKKARFRKRPRNLLITFGGTDPKNFTLKTLCAVQKLCRQNAIRIFVVTGPGYLHRESLLKYLAEMDYQNHEYVHKTGVMSSIMEKADVAISSAGRTVYELAHMRVPAIILAQHAREHTHAFARPENGFEYLGVMETFDVGSLRESLHKFLNGHYRRTLYDRMKRFSFGLNKRRVIKRILSLIE
jgi:spore coat polysaccharide biosynthesis predicted glycosyltransferase SpsG/CMP-N-acetylneuraminic acid synthetase